MTVENSVPYRGWRLFLKHQVITFGWSDDCEWSTPGNILLENGRIWSWTRYREKLIIVAKG